MATPSPTGNPTAGFGISSRENLPGKFSNHVRFAEWREERGGHGRTQIGEGTAAEVEILTVISSMILGRRL